MGDQQTPTAGPDLTQGVSLATLPDGGMIAGRVGDEAVLLARVGEELFAVGATCTHYGGPLAEGLLVGDTVRCPWHHACFSLRTGDALRAPALRPLARYEVQRRGDIVTVTTKIGPADPELAGVAGGTSAGGHRARVPDSVVIIGAGAAGAAAAEMLRREGYAAPVTLVDGDDDAPYDRPNLSKDYLAGNAPEEWIPLRSPEFYRDHGIDLVRGTRAARLDLASKQVVLEDGRAIAFGALLIATGSTPVRLPASLSANRDIHYLRTLADSRAIIAAASSSRRAVVIGASFIGLEVAASLRARGLEVHVVAPEHRPLERVLGPAVGEFLRKLHEEHGVVFHLGHTAAAIDESSVTVDDGTRIGAELVVAGIGVRPTTALAEQGGIAVARGINVDEYLETNVRGIFAAGDIAYWPDSHTGDRIHVEHWVVAERQGQTAARNILGAAERFDSVPFFWSAHYDMTISYVGHAERWDTIDINGSLEARDATVSYRLGGATRAVATIGRDRASLETEVEMERRLAPAAAGVA